MFFVLFFAKFCSLIRFIGLGVVIIYYKAYAIPKYYEYNILYDLCRYGPSFFEFYSSV